jgi:hypothetical protein
MSPQVFELFIAVSEAVVPLHRAELATVPVGGSDAVSVKLPTAFAAGRDVSSRERSVIGGPLDIGQPSVHPRHGGYRRLTLIEFRARVCTAVG